GWDTAAFVSGYPGSPLGSFDGAVAAAARLAPDLPVVCRPAVNEELAASSVMGAQLASLQPDRRHEGVVGIWYGKGPGVDRASDALRHAVFAGTSSRGGAVALVGDDPEAKSSTIPSSSAGAAADMHMPMLYPGDPSEALDLGRHAIALSRTTGLWVALKIVADVADATASVTLHPDRVDPTIPTVDGERYRHQPDGRLLTPHTLELEREIIEVRYELATRYASQNRLNHLTTEPSDAWIGIVASGVTYRELREALGRLGLDDTAAIEAVGIRLLQMGMPFPFDPRTIRRFADGVDEVLVIEEKRPTIESLIKDTLYPLTNRPVVVGKFDENDDQLLPEHGALDADRLVPVLWSRLQERLSDRLTPPPPPPRERIPIAGQRAPFYCSGCPHNRSTRAPEGALVGAGIGCHTMAMLMDPDRFGDIAGVTCMGSEGAQWIGMSQFVDRDHFIQNVGDGTYFHSAQLAIQASVAAGVNITYKLLYNDAVAMTGGQDPQGQLGVPELTRVLWAQGVRRVLITTDDVSAYDDVELVAGTDVWHRDRLDEAQQILAATDGVTVLIHDQACAAELRRARKRGRLPTPTTQVVINARICEGCGDCGEKSNCLSVQPIETEFGRKTAIDQTSCNFDYSCLQGDCPSFMTIDHRPPGRIARLLGRPAEPTDTTERVTPTPPPVDDPVIAVGVDDYAVRITGIGGTGVVTVAQVIGTAAMLDGFHVGGLDQTGLSQKAGPVVSDVRLSQTRPIASNRLGQGQADLLMAFDQLVAASDKSLQTCDPERTAIVGSLSAVPTGEMVSHLEATMPGAAELARRIGDAGRPDGQHWADAQAITTDLFGQATT
ncbi:MAG: indolepyruvate ferredoxin oxidoreductase family protein, partial [Acidimicrobiales bacterium]